MNLYDKNQNLYGFIFEGKIKKMWGGCRNVSPALSNLKISFSNIFLRENLVRNLYAFVWQFAKFLQNPFQPKNGFSTSVVSPALPELKKKFFQHFPSRKFSTEFVCVRVTICEIFTKSLPTEKRFIN